MHDPVWARLAEANVPVAFHLGDSGYNALLGAPWGGAEDFAPFREPDLLGHVIIGDRAIHDTMASMIVHGVFKRHPNLRVASIENGSDWVYPLVKVLRKQANQTPWVFEEDPLDTIKKHVWITPSTRKTCAGSPTRSESSASCSAPTGRTAKGWRNPGRSWRSCRTSTPTSSTGSCGPTVRSWSGYRDPRWREAFTTPKAVS
jgi:hypothetical protein